MITDSGAKSGEVLDGRELHLVPTPSRFIDLKTLHDVRVEMARVYREMRASRIETQDGTRLVYVLSQIGRIVEIQEVGNRLEAVERVLRLRGNP